MSIINCKSEITENKYMNFWNKIRKILKRIWIKNLIHILYQYSHINHLVKHLMQDKILLFHNL
jgi:hypothetical protein